MGLNPNLLHGVYYTFSFLQAYSSWSSCNIKIIDLIVNTTFHWKYIMHAYYCEILRMVIIKRFCIICRILPSWLGINIAVYRLMIFTAHEIAASIMFDAWKIKITLYAWPTTSSTCQHINNLVNNRL